MAKQTSSAANVRSALTSLKRASSASYREGLVRYGIHAPKAFGVPMGKIQALGKKLGRDHQLAEGLWRTGWYEARLLAAYVGEPERITPAQMDRWCRDFDNWGICDTICFCLFDRTPHAYRKIAEWAKRREEFVKRAAFALLASVALHHKTSPDAPFRTFLPIIERAATDERNFVKKGVSWALRSIGGRSLPLNQESVLVARRLAASSDATARWVGKDALRALDNARLRARIMRRGKGRSR